MFGWVCVGTVIFVVLLMAFGFWFIPVYGVWKAGLTGKAALMRAEQEKQIQIEQAKAELESAKLRAQAIEIVGQASKDFPEYRTQEFIGAFGEAVKSGAINQIIYVPTEANIPIVEAGRVGAKQTGVQQ
jgi:regulator of protease activity HflC (stomatin/prohibitin superfamily)